MGESMNHRPSSHPSLHNRAVGRSENPEGRVVMWRAKSAPLIEIGLAYLPKYWGAIAPFPLVPTALHSFDGIIITVFFLSRNIDDMQTNEA
jgi:hypothetical protein